LKDYKLTLFKIRANTEEGHHRLVTKEAMYYTTVCHFCDNQFCEAYQAKKHIEFEHEQKQVAFKYDHCESTFHSPKAKQYHEMTEHSTSLSSVSCDIFQKTFASVINLKNHKKMSTQILGSRNVI
jgi:hypothetical protein